MAKIALITGITGQDGSYLAELLLKKKYEVHGVVRREALEDQKHRLWRIKKIKNDIKLHATSIENYLNLYKIIKKINPDEVYHLAAQSYVSNSFKDEFSTFTTNINGTHNILSAIKELDKKMKFYFAASSEMFGEVKKTPQDENTPLNPRSPYGISKLTGYHLSKHYKEAYGIHAACGILFNHESPRRGLEFVTRKISYSVAKIKYGLQKKIKLGNINAKRDWGHAEDYVKAMWLILQQKKPDNYVVGTGVGHTVKDFAKKAFECVNLNYRDYIELDKNLIRPTEINSLIANYSKIKKDLKWKPTITFNNLVEEMVEADLEFVKKNKY
tara:strand:+ start:3371 stop:4354 length:984 start_codon:yes stop_codon:yes gene_type:complete